MFSTAQIKHSPSFVDGESRSHQLNYADTISFDSKQFELTPAMVRASH
ncbi:hypothetical protein [Rubritalea tangerina]